MADEGEDRAIDEIQSMTLRSDGKYDVVCKNGTKEVVTSQQISESRVCGGGGPVPGPEVVAVSSRTQGNFFVLCKNSSWEIGTSQQIQHGKVCKGQTGDTQTTTTGHVFTRDTSNPSLGEAWRDPSGMVWGDLVKKEDGTANNMNQYKATDYCKGIGAELPSRKAIIRLREYMGAKPGGYVGYSPQILPNLVIGGKDLFFWSSSVFPIDSDLAYYFDGRFGYIGHYYRSAGVPNSVRCVARR